MPRPMQVLGAVVQTERGGTALFLDNDRAMLYAGQHANHGQCSVGNLVTEADAFRYALEWIKERLPYGLEALTEGWSNHADDY